MLNCVDLVMNCISVVINCKAASWLLLCRQSSINQIGRYDDEINPSEGIKKQSNTSHVKLCENAMKEKESVTQNIQNK